MAKTKSKTNYVCRQCGYESQQFIGRCPGCQEWNSLEERTQMAEAPPHNLARRTGVASSATPQMLAHISIDEEVSRYTSGFPELDRVLGGGFISGSYVLFGGDPGIGKSTLMLQIAENVAAKGKTVLYIAGEESPHQIKMRSQRLGLTGNRILIYSETNMRQVHEEILTIKPDMVIVDSIQSVYEPEISGTPGGINQIKECAAQLMVTAKSLDITVLLVGHVTKEGQLSGPKVLEHTVDTVLYFEGEKFKNLRILRAIKNRFGNTNEIGVFDIGEQGLMEVTNPSALFLSENRYESQPGSVIVATMEGNRPILVEIQALLGATGYAVARRVGNGIDMGRLHQIVAVLERRLGLDFSKQDIYANVVGGLKIQEPAADLGLALALISSARNLPIKPKTVVTGEIGLTGEIRPVGYLDSRVAEAAKLGFDRIVVPRTGQDKVGDSKQKGITCVGVRHFMDALVHCLDQNTNMAHNQNHDGLV